MSMRRRLFLLLGLLLLGLSLFQLVKSKSPLSLRPAVSQSALGESGKRIIDTLAQLPKMGSSTLKPAASTSRKAISNEQAYCRLKAANFGIPLDGELKLQSLSYDSDENGNPGFWVWVHSSECPPNTFSRVQMDYIGRVKELVNCREALPEEILIKASIQGASMEVPAGPNELKFSIFRSGFFVLRCADELFLSRSGDFRFDGGKLKSKDCTVLAQDGSAFEPKGEEVDEQGCTRYGHCLALVMPQDPKAIQYVDRFTLRALKDPFRTPVTERRLFLNSLEDFSDPRVGPLGPDWEKYSAFKTPECSKVEL